MAKAADMVFANPQLVEKYVKFRPTPPPTLVNTVVEHVREGRRKAGGVAELCVDLGCGSGQSTGPLAPHFPSVVGVDVSQAQLDAGAQELKHLPNVSFRLGSAEAMPFEDASVDVVTCCAAVHWFNFDAFYKEVDRVLRPGGVVACYGYLIFTPVCNGHNLQSVYLELFHELDPYWPETHKHLWTEHASLPQLYPIDTHIGSQEGGFSVVLEGTMDEVMGYVSSTSGVEKLRNDKGEQAAADYLTRAKKRLHEAAGIDIEDSSAPATRQYSYFLRMWQKPLVVSKMAKAADMVFANPQLVEKYVKFRPTPPQTLINTVVEHVREGRRKAGGVAELCVDLGCGSGQSTGPLAPHFPAVVGVDVSQAQLDAGAQELKHLHNVSFRVGSAEGLPFEANSIDIITCCAAAHWFNFETFYKEVDRVLRPGGVLACYSYITCIPLCNGRNLHSLLVEFFHELDPYWTEGHQHLWKEYASLPPLYPTDTHIGTQDGAFSVVLEGTMDGILGYVSSWSAVDKLRKNEGEQAAVDYLGRAKKRLFKAAGIGTEESEVPVTRQYNYFLRMWQKPHP